MKVYNAKVELANQCKYTFQLAQLWLYKMLQISSYLFSIVLNILLCVNWVIEYIINIRKTSSFIFLFFIVIFMVCISKFIYEYQTVCQHVCCFCLYSEFFGSISHCLINLLQIIVCRLLSVCRNRQKNSQWKNNRQ